MNPYKILEYPDLKLTKKAEYIETITDEIREKAYRMLCTLVLSKDGIALASTQVGVPESIIVFWADSKDRRENPEQPFILYNARLYSVSFSSVDSYEGCLSLPGIMVPVRRASSIMVRGIMDKGRDTRYIENKQIDGETAIILQHEIDHLNGKTLLDHVSGLKRQLFEKKMKKFKSRMGR